MWKWILIAVIFLTLSLALTLRPANIEGIQPLGFRVGPTGLVLEAKIIINNPNIFDITLDSIDYNIYFTETRQVIGYGQIQSTKLKARTKTEISINQTINWKPTVGLTIQLLSKPNVPLTIAGKATVVTPVYGASEVPFSETFDIKESLRLIMRSTIPI